MYGHPVYCFEVTVDLFWLQPLHLLHIYNNMRTFSIFFQWFLVNVVQSTITCTSIFCWTWSVLQSLTCNYLLSCLLMSSQISAATLDGMLWLKQCLTPIHLLWSSPSAGTNLTGQFLTSTSSAVGWCVLSAHTWYYMVTFFAHLHTTAAAFLALPPIVVLLLVLFLHKTPCSVAVWFHQRFWILQAKGHMHATLNNDTVSCSVFISLQLPYSFVRPIPPKWLLSIILDCVTSSIKGSKTEWFKLTVLFPFSGWPAKDPCIYSIWNFDRLNTKAAEHWQMNDSHAPFLKKISSPCAKHTDAKAVS